MKKTAQKKTIRVLHCPTTVGGNPQSLAKAERELGLDSWSVTFFKNYFGFETDEVLWKEGEHPIICEIKRFWLLGRALTRYDIIHFNFGQTIFPHRHGLIQKNQTGISTWINQVYHRYPYWVKKAYEYYANLLELQDLVLLKKARKGIVVTYQGDDARQGDYCLSHFEICPAKEVEPGYYSPETDAFKAERIKKFSIYADRIFSLNPDLLHVLPSHAKFMPYANVDMREMKPVAQYHPSLNPIVVHAPSHQGVKGTRYILEAVERLKKEGIPFTFFLVEGISNAEARKLYQKADLLIDQLLCGWYGGVAVEFMAMGKPVICYIRQGDLQFIPEEMRDELPIINANPNSIYEVLREYLTYRKKDLPEIGKRSRKFVEKWHDPLKIAGALKKEYEAILGLKEKGPF